MSEPPYRRTEFRADGSDALRDERRLREEMRGGSPYEYGRTRTLDRREHEGNVGMLAFLVGALLVAVIAVALWFVYEGNAAPADSDDADVTVELPAPPPMPEAPRLPDAPDLPRAPDLPTPNVGQAVGEATETVREALPDNPLPPATADPAPEPPPIQ